LCKILEKYKILDAVNTVISDGREVYDPTRYLFLGDVIDHFRHDGKSVNFVCFLYDYLLAVSSEAWQRKKKSRSSSPTLSNKLKNTLRAKEGFDK